MEPLDFAKAYLKFGWSLIPIDPNTKKPAFKYLPVNKQTGKPEWLPFTKRRASIKEVEVWLNNGCSLAVVTGDISGICIVDDDRIKNGLKEWEFDSPVIAKTQSGGKHYYFKYDREIHSHPNTTLHIDLKAWHSYCLVPPFNGRTWVSKPSENLSKLEPLPDEIVRLINSDMDTAGRNEPLRMADFMDIDIGSRENDFYRIACSKFALMKKEGMDEDGTLRLLWGVNLTYKPPISEDRFKYQTARALKFVTDNKNSDNMGLNSFNSFNSFTEKNIVGWPKPMAPEAFHGPLGELVKIIMPHTESSAEAILTNNLVAFGNLIGDKPHFKHEANRHPGRIFIVQVGKTAEGMKGTSFGHTKMIFDLVEPGWEKKLQGGLGSGEAIVYSVRDEIRKEKTHKDGTVEELIIDPGVTDKRAVFLEDEFSSILTVMARQGNILGQIIRRAWDSGNLQNLVKNSPLRATGAHIAIYGHITPSELQKCLTESDMKSGFSNRFLWICTKRSKYLPRGGNLKQADLLPVINKLKQAYSFAKNIDEFERSEDTWIMWDKIYPALSDLPGGLIGALTSRVKAYITRLSLIYAAADSTDIIRPEHMKAALAVWDYNVESVKYIFQNQTGDAIANKILKALIRGGDYGLTRTDISNLFDRNMPAEKITSALETLTSANLAIMETKKTEGRDLEIWKIIQTEPKKAP